MAKILGKYIIRASLVDFSTEFTFQNADQDTRLTVNSDTLLSCTCADITRPVNNAVSFVKNNVLKVRGVRILTTGAEGLRCGKNDKAANLLFVAQGLQDTSTPVGSFQVNVDRYNEWEPVNIDFLCNIASAPNENFYLSLDHTYSFLSLEDFNIQDDYIGLGFTPFVELQIDTAGIFDYDGKVA